MAEGGSNNEEENEDTIKAGFVPINQAVKNAEVRSAVAATVEEN